MIGLADNTGNSFGSHLHLTLKIDGTKTPGYPAGIVDPWPYLQDFILAPDLTQPIESGLVVYTNTEMKLRFGPNLGYPVVALLPAGEALRYWAKPSSSSPGLALKANGSRFKLQLALPAMWLPGSCKIPYKPFPLQTWSSIRLMRLDLRSGPGTAFHLIDTLTMDDPLTVLGDPDLAQTKLGKQGEWLQIQTTNGDRGFVAAWLVHLTGQTAASTELVVYPTIWLNVRARPSTDGNILVVVSPEDALAVLGSKEQVLTRVGQAEQWLNVRTPAKQVGYVAAWLVRSAGDVPPQPTSRYSRTIGLPSG